VRDRISFQAVDPFILLAIVMLVVWAVGTWFEMAGWIHILLTAGVFLLAWRIATRGEKVRGEG
jgi:steroid 5-alpha reductase family enzyme